MKIRQIFEAVEDRLELTKLPYNTGDLAPVLSKDNVEYHYNVLSKGYVNRYNNKEGDPKFNCLFFDKNSFFKSSKKLSQYIH